MEEKKIWRKIKNKFKLNKLIIYVYFKLILFVSFYYIIKDYEILKICRILIIFDFLLYFPL